MEAAQRLDGSSRGSKMKLSYPAPPLSPRVLKRPPYADCMHIIAGGSEAVSCLVARLGTPTLAHPPPPYPFFLRACMHTSHRTKGQAVVISRNKKPRHGNRPARHAGGAPPQRRQNQLTGATAEPRASGELFVMGWLEAKEKGRGCEFD